MTPLQTDVCDCMAAIDAVSAGGVHGLHRMQTKTGRDLLVELGNLFRELNTSRARAFADREALRVAVDTENSLRDLCATLTDRVQTLEAGLETRNV